LIEDDCFVQFVGNIGGGANAKTYVAFHTVTLSSENVEVTGKDFLNRRGLIQGRKVEFNGVGSITNSTPGISGWTIFLYKGLPAVGEPNVNDAFAWTTTDSGGNYKFTKLCPDTYYVYEETRDGWAQTYPASEFYTIALARGSAANKKDFGNIEVYNICGFKYLADTQEGLVDWTINLYKLNPDTGLYPTEPTMTTDTDVNGKYCFEGLFAGTYKVTETVKEGWVQVCPDPLVNEGAHIVTLPAGATDPEACEPLYYNFCNKPALECFDETVWAADGEPGVTRFIPAPGNWATYVEYTFGAGTSLEPKVYNLYAGQTFLAGELLVYDSDGKLYEKYRIFGEDNEFKDGYCGDWTSLTEYHLQVVDTFEGFNPYRVFNTRTGYGAPIPGSFDKKLVLEKENAVSETDWIEVEIVTTDNSVFIAAHGVAWWCGYQCNNGTEFNPSSFDAAKMLNMID
jgi:hypothetical protein